MNSVLLSVAQMQEAERLTMAAGTTGFVLMQRAGEAVAREITRRYAPQPTAILCGPGNNGGDGLVVAFELAKSGWPVRLALYGDAGSLQGDARMHAQRWAGGMEPLTPRVIESAALVVDALFGSGLNRRLDARAIETLALAERRGVPIIAIDTPSGVMGDSGESHGATRSNCTVTFMRKKPAHVLLPGRDLCGEVVIADIGIPAALLDMLSLNTWENDPALWLDRLRPPNSSDNKYRRGHALLYGGYPVTGAARMAGRAAARIGAGLTTIAVPDQALAIYAAALTSIMVQPLREASDFERLLTDARYTAFLIGPGAGVNEGTQARALRMLQTTKPVLLDADAISAFAAQPEALFQAIRGPCVITPHEGEFKRIFNAAGDKLSRARSAASRSGAVVVLKGSDTVIAAPDGRAIINSNAPPTLATAGSGDVLGGLILGLLAQGMDAFHAAAAGAWLHGAAAAEFGPGLIAEDLPEQIPAVLRRLARDEYQ
ncbi:MAG TPA: NAD(P)H-hydrate dehydratase [Steroidobacteraceae bacterium]|jgi:NAD(P)H-hydrate epimerase